MKATAEIGRSAPLAAIPAPRGLKFHPGYLDRTQQQALLTTLRGIFEAAPLFTPRMPRSGRPFTVRMSNCGPLGWVSDEAGYRYQPTHPVTGAPWPPMPEMLIAIWRDLAGYPAPPQACLINFYAADAKMGLHQDRDEEDFAAPVVSLSLGDSCLFRVGGQKRSDPTRSVRLRSGDAVVLGGDTRLAFHGVDRIEPGTSTLLAEGGRINLTMRRVTRAVTAVALAVALVGLAVAAPAQAADPIFPPASRVGLVPPPGMAVSKSFYGFEDVSKDAAILLATQPAAAFAELDKSLAAENLKKQGIAVDKREAMQFAFGNGILVVGKQTADKTRYRKWLLVAQAGDLTALVNAQEPEQETAYPDAVMRAALATLAVRATVPDEEKLALLPFVVGDLAGFHVENILPGRAVMLIDTPDGAPTAKFDSHLFVAAFQGGPAEADDRAQFARLTFGQIVGIKDVLITMSEPLRIGGQPGFQTMAQAKDIKTGDDIMVAQWLRFGTGGFLQMIGMAKTDGWPAALSRLRAVRDSIQPR